MANLNLNFLEGMFNETVGADYVVYSKLPLGNHVAEMVNFIVINGNKAQDLYGNVTDVQVLEDYSRVIYYKESQLATSGRKIYLSSEQFQWVFIAKPADYDFEPIACKWQWMFDRQINGLKGQLDIKTSTAMEVVKASFNKSIVISKYNEQYMHDGEQKTVVKTEFVKAYSAPKAAQTETVEEILSLPEME